MSQQPSKYGAIPPGKISYNVIGSGNNQQQQNNQDQNQQSETFHHEDVPFSSEELLHLINNKNNNNNSNNSRNSNQNYSGYSSSVSAPPPPQMFSNQQQQNQNQNQNRFFTSKTSSTTRYQNSNNNSSMNYQQQQQNYSNQQPQYNNSNINANFFPTNQQQQTGNSFRMIPPNSNNYYTNANMNNNNSNILPPTTNNNSGRYSATPSPSFVASIMGVGNTSTVQNMQHQQQQQQQNMNYSHQYSQQQQQKLPSSTITTTTSQGGRGNLMSFRTVQTQNQWPKIIREAQNTLIQSKKYDQPEKQQLTSKLSSELTSLVASIQAKQRTALLSKRSLEQYERALRDVADDGSSQSALELWKVLDETSSTVNRKLKEIRVKFETQHQNQNQQASSSSSVSRRRNTRNNNIINNALSVNDVATAVSKGHEITPEQALTLLESSQEFVGKLLPFQEESLAFFLSLNSRGAHGLNGDEMGLGKTVQAISVMIAARQLHRSGFVAPQTIGENENENVDEGKKKDTSSSGGGRGGRGGRGRGNSSAASGNQNSNNNNTSINNRTPPPSIVVAPLSTASSWAHEFKTFAPTLRVGVLGTADDRAKMLREFFGEEEFSFKNTTATAKQQKQQKAKVVVAPKRRRRKNVDSSSSEEEEEDSSSSEEEESDENDDDSSSDEDEETSSEEEEFDEDGETDDDDDDAATRRRKKQQMLFSSSRGRGRGGRGGGNNNNNKNSSSSTSTSSGKNPIFGFDVLVVPQHFLSQHRYALAKKYIPKLAKTKWFYCIVDEAHRIKNDAATLTWTLQQFKNVSHRLVLTGTPLQNSLDELWTLLSFLLPNVFAKAQFTSLFKAISELHEIPGNSKKDSVVAVVDVVNNDNDENKNKKKKVGVQQGKKKTNKNTNQQQQQQTSSVELERKRALAEERQFLLCRKIHDVLLPLMVRREKKDVMLELPKLMEWFVLCPSSALQRFEAATILAHNKQVMLKDAAAAATSSYTSNRNTNTIQLKQKNQQRQDEFDDDDDGNNNNNNNKDEDEEDEILGSVKRKTRNSNKNNNAETTTTLEEEQEEEEVSDLSIFCERRLALHPFLLRKKDFVNKLLCDEEIQQNVSVGSGKLVMLDLFLRFIHAWNEKLISEEEEEEEENSENENENEEFLSDNNTEQKHKKKSSSWMKRHKILIFSQFTSLLDIVETHIGWCRNWPYLRLDGSTGNRAELLDQFQKDDDQFIFLLSKGAGGVGLNLQSADTVVMLDIDFNPTQDAQAIARAYRVGQKKDVLVLRLVSEFPAEHDMLSVAMKKEELEDRVIRAGMFDMKTDDEVRDNALRERVFSDGNYASSSSENKNETDNLTHQQQNNNNDNNSGNKSVRRQKHVSKINFSNIQSTSSFSTTTSTAQKNQQRQQEEAQVREILKKEILRFFPRTEDEKVFLQHLIDHENFLDEAIFTLTPRRDFPPEDSRSFVPNCLLMKEEEKAKQWKDGVTLIAQTTDLTVTGPRAAAVAAEQRFLERRRLIEAGELEEEDGDW